MLKLKLRYKHDYVNNIIVGLRYCILLWHWLLPRCISLHDHVTGDVIASCIPLMAQHLMGAPVSSPWSPHSKLTKPHLSTMPL